MDKVFAPLGTAFLLLIGAVLLALIMAWPVQLLWNSCLVPAVNPINEITFLQALGINLLASLMFNSGVRSKSSE